MSSRMLNLLTKGLSIGVDKGDMSNLAPPTDMIQEAGFYAYGEHGGKDWLRFARRQVEGGGWVGTTTCSRGRRVDGLFYADRRSCRLEWSLFGGGDV